jgi:hypothetical protein
MEHRLHKRAHGGHKNSKDNKHGGGHWSTRHARVRRTWACTRMSCVTSCNFFFTLLRTTSTLRVLWRRAWFHVAGCFN